MNMQSMNSVEKSLRTNKFSRGHRLSVPGIHGVAFNWPTIDWKTGKIGVRTSIRTFEEDGRHSKVFTGKLVDEFKGNNLTIGDVLKRIGLKTYHNSAIAVFDAASPGQKEQKLEIMPVKCSSEKAARNAAFTMTHGFC